MAPSGLRQVLDLAFANSAHGRPSISTALRELIFDRDAIFNGRVLSTVTALGLRLAKTAYRSPWKNGIAERWVGACVANCLIAPSSSTSATFADCLESTLPITMETARTTRLRRRLPAVDYSRLSEGTSSSVVASRRLGGFHHRYDWAEQLAG